MDSTTGTKQHTVEKYLERRHIFNTHAQNLAAHLLRIFLATLPYNRTSQPDTVTNTLTLELNTGSISFTTGNAAVMYFHLTPIQAKCERIYHNLEDKKMSLGFPGGHIEIKSQNDVCPSLHG